MEFGVPLLVFAAVLAVTTELSILRRNPRRSVSPWRYPEREPKLEQINRMLVAAMGTLAAVELSHVMGYWWFFPLLLAVMVAPIVLRLRHNRRVAAT
ncbi:MAG TPA: hypothetical protein VFI97_04460 [Arthrobacter sp.]|nr:hypothetical protein [Arthrobacter sp.]